MTGRPISSTDAVHAGSAPCDTTASLTTPIVLSAPFTFGSTAEIMEYLEGRSQREQPEYARQGNPTTRTVERRIAALEGAERAVLFASGMAAVSTLALTFLKAGDHVILTKDCYPRTRDLLSSFLSKFQVRCSLVEPTYEAIASALKPETALFLTECPSNPHLRVVDIPAVSALAKEKGFLTVVDSTFATPVNLQPLQAGADLVLHSATKYLGGHNDLLAGVVAGRRELIDQLAEQSANLGGVCHPHTAYLLERGLKTLALRVAKQNETGRQVAEFLAGHPKVTRVFYPGLKDHPDHSVAARLLRGFGGVVTFEIKGDSKAAGAFIDKLRIPKLAPSLGGVESLVEQVALMGYWEKTPEEKAAYGITDTLIRLSVGIEEPQDLIADLKQALEA